MSYCSKCYVGYVLNDFGICGACWSGMDDDERDALISFLPGDRPKEPREQVRVTTYSIPVSPSRMGWFLLAATGGIVGCALGELLTAFLRSKGWVP